jgi:hypothetical protein
VWAFVLLDERRDLGAGLLASVAALARPNGIVLVIALAVAVGRDRRRLLVVCGPAAVALAGWTVVNLASTGDALRFFHAKAAWHEVTLAGLVSHASRPAVVHLVLASIAAAFLVAARRRLPASWQVLGVLSLVPSLALGVVGLGRYANECFPVFAAGADWMARHGRVFRSVVFASMVAGGLLFTVWVVGAHHVP